MQDISFLSLNRSSFLFFSFFFIIIIIIKDWAHKDSLTPSLFIEVHVPNQKGGRSCICLLEGIELVPSNDFSIRFWNRSDSVVFLCLSFYFI